MVVGESLQLCVNLDPSRGSSCLLDLDLDGGLRRLWWVGLLQVRVEGGQGDFMRGIGMSILVFVWFLVYVYRKSL